MRRLWVFSALALMGLAHPVAAQTIYPLHKAEILAGAYFDLKVEWPGAPGAAAVSVTINGSSLRDVLGSDAAFVEREEGQEHSASWVKNASIAKPGRYVVEATVGGQKTSAIWDVFATAERPVARNVILFIGDGLSIAHRTAARMLSKGIHEGRYGGDLAMDDMPHMALVSTAGTDSIITDSANSMSAYTTGHKSCVNALGVYCARNKDPKAHPRVETLTSLAKRRAGLAVGIVSNTEIQDATPAAMVANTRRRSDFNDIVGMFFDAQPEVILGGGASYFLPASSPGSKRKDDQDYLAKFAGKGYVVADTGDAMNAAASRAETTRLLGLFNSGNLDGALDRKFLKAGSVARYPDQPDLVDQLNAALQVLSRSPKGFVLAVESGQIDKYSHALDWERAVYDTIMLDNAVKVAKDWAASRGDTLIIVVADHAHPVSIIGTVDDGTPGERLRDKLGVYARAGFPNYPAPDAQGYPVSVDVSRRLFMSFGAYPDHCRSGKPYLRGEFVPAKPDADGKTQIANEEYCGPGAARMQGNLPVTANRGVHAADDVILTAIGPGASQFRGHMENTRVFRAIANALALGAPQ